MHIHHWGWYIIDPTEARWYHYWQREISDRLIVEKPTNHNLFKLLTRIMKDGRIMAREKQQSRSGKSDANVAIRWLNTTLTDEDYAGITELLDAGIDTMAGYIFNAAERLANISIKPGRDDDFMCSIVWTLDRSNGSKSYGLSGFGRSPQDAVASALYKFIVLYNWGDVDEEALDDVKPRFR